MDFSRIAKKIEEIVTRYLNLDLTVIDVPLITESKVVQENYQI